MENIKIEDTPKVGEKIGQAQSINNVQVNKPIDEGKDERKIEEEQSKLKILKEKILKFFTGDPLKRGEERKNGNPSLNAEYKRLLESDPERAQKFLTALGKYEYLTWDEKEQDYKDIGQRGSTIS